MKLSINTTIGVIVMAGLLNTGLNAGDTDRKVFAHYMTCFTATPEFYKREIMLAQHYGIDGFALNCGEWFKPVKGKEPQPTRYVSNADNIFEQAKQLNTGFKLFMSPDFACKSIREWSMLNVTSMFTRYAKHPNLFHYRGKPFYSGYSGLPEQYAPPIKKLRADGYDFLLVPKASTPNWKMAMSMESVLRTLKPGTPFDGLFNFSCDGTVRNILQNNAIYRRGTLFADKIYMAGVCPAYNSPNLRDFRGMAGYCAMWQGLINDGADLVEIVTWNDYNEDSNLMPYRWKSGFGSKALQKAYYNRDESYLDVSSYFIKYFKNDIAPEITQDRIYFSYRARSKKQVKVWNEQTGKWVDIRFDKHPYDQLHDDVKDCIYVTGFLTAPAELEVSIGGKTAKFKLAKGISSCELPFKPGVPRFKLTRKGQTLIDVYGRKTIIDKISKANSEKGYHLANRTWTSGAVAGIPTISLNGKNTLVDVKSSLTLKLPKLKTGTYNFRVTYANATGKESRLTMYCNGAPGATGAQPFYFPLFLPDTGGESRTISFLWSIWDNASKLEIKCDDSKDPKLVKWGYPDIGTATIKSIDLIPVEQFKTVNKTGLPELVAIPGGSFTMGCNDANPDEAPAHEVTLSPFAIGKYEVTNAEYEQFDPSHKAHRDGFSWRDNEPVIYVSWKHAAAYCNWLSKKHSLKPVYDEKSWKIDMKADGFRLPTEAEWEFVATGRGQNRTYPWGNQKPTADRGNFMLNKALAINPVLSASIKNGVMIRGAFPKGASRDGVMDMAGNVSEWCSDYFNDYQPGKQVDPCDQRKSHHRVIRGGSWGYYNYSQRGRDREFNNDGYPGYIYLGLRVALPQTGFEKLNKK